MRLLLVTCIIALFFATIYTANGSEIGDYKLSELSTNELNTGNLSEIISFTELKNIVFKGDQLICRGGAKYLNKKVESISISVYDPKDNLAIGSNTNVLVQVNTLDNNIEFSIFDYIMQFTSLPSNYTHINFSTAKLFYNLSYKLRVNAIYTQSSEVSDNIITYYSKSFTT
jgi:hypothetical protein